MQPLATILCDESSYRREEQLIKLASLLGVPYRECYVSACERLLEQAPPKSVCLLSHATTLSRWLHTHAAPERALALLVRKAHTVFAYGFTPEREHVALASALCDGNINDIKAFRNSEQNCDVAPCCSELTKEFSGLSFGPIRAEQAAGFVCDTQRDLSNIVSIAGLPTFVRSGHADCSTYLLGCDILDIEESVGSLGPDIHECFLRLLPAAMFLRWMFGDRCWHNPNRSAAFIIDDPLLKTTHGYLNYRDLVGIMDSEEFATTIAFIPWNYKRTRSDVARLFRERSDRLSLCVHGCDHSQAEFVPNDAESLNQKVRVATSRMDTHWKTTGVQYSRAMVFPRGEFSPAALKVLQANNYLGAVNTRALTTGRELQVRDFLECALTSYEGVSLFTRRYPGPLEQFAFDLFFGRPVLVVEHHRYLRDRGKSLASFIRGLKSLDQLQWSSVGDVLKRSYMQRALSPGVVACRLYSNTQNLRNDAARNRVFLVSKHQAEDIPIESVLVNGRKVDYRSVGDCVQMEINMPSHSTAEVGFVYRNVWPCAEPEHSFRSTHQTFVRRILSEWRDDLTRIATNLFSGDIDAIRG